MDLGRREMNYRNPPRVIFRFGNLCFDVGSEAVMAADRFATTAQWTMAAALVLNHS